MTKLLLLGLWPIAAMTTLVASILLFMILPLPSASEVKGAKTSRDIELRTNYQLFTALPTDNLIVEETTLEDARIELVGQFLAHYNSPLIPHAELLVKTADVYNLDFRLLPAVAMQESTLCKKIPENSHNCWGYGIYGDKILRFDSYEEAIENVGKGLSSDYIHEGLTTPEQIMNRYTPSSDGSWAASVRSFMEEME